MAQSDGAAATTATAVAPATTALVWFRPGDLRLSDHEPLHNAAQSAALHNEGALLLPFACLEERDLVPSGPLGLPRLGPHRLRLLLEALSSLRGALRGRGSELLFSCGCTEAAVGRLVALAAGAGSTHVALHHYMQPGAASAELEDAVAARFAAVAAQHGEYGLGPMRSSVHRYWGCTLYHPDDLPYALWQAQGSPAAGNEHSGLDSNGTSAGEAQVAGPTAAAEQQGGRPSSRPNRQQQRFACLPRVMSDFRRPLQAAATVRPPLPAPCPADSAPADSRSDAAVLPPFPAALAAAAAEAGLVAGIPTEPAGLYAAAGPAGEAALARWEHLTGQRCASLAPAGCGTHDPRSAVPFTMGEEQALQRLRHILGLPAQGPPGSGCSSEQSPVRPAPIDEYQDSRMTATGVDSSAKLSAFLSLGCLSPRSVWAETARLAAVEQQQQQQQGQREGQRGEEPLPGALRWREPQRGDTWRWLLMHLGIRDFFLYSALKEGAALEQPGGLSGRHMEWLHDEALFLRWTRGQTGIPFVDASMRELAATGYMSNRGRQNVASFLSKSLGLDWRWGAAYFESVLADSDWAINLGNWAYNSGTGADPRDRRFCTVSQGLRYDPEAELICRWVPELAALPTELAHQPWQATPEQMAAAGVQLESAEQAGADLVVADTEAAADVAEAAGHHWYPLPLVDPATQVAKGHKQAKQKQAAASKAAPTRAVH
ncbi:hypothetical protein ABPG77_002947 [Micractinium sp. CCAP 211/92]